LRRLVAHISLAIRELLIRLTFGSGVGGMAAALRRVCQLLVSDSLVMLSSFNFIDGVSYELGFSLTKSSKSKAKKKLWKDHD